MVTRVSLFFGAAILAVSFATVVACSDDGGDSKFQEPPEAGDDSTTPIGPLVPEAGGEGGTDGPAASCEPQIPSTFKPTWTAPAKQANACAKEDIQGYWDACLKDPNTKDACAAFATAHATCNACIEGTNGQGPVQWRLNRLYYGLNVAGCIALRGAESCGEPFSAAVQCSRESCEPCLTATLDFKKFSACQTQSQTVGVCKSYQNTQNDACQGIADAGAPTLDCFIDKGAGETQEVLFNRMAGYFCGP